MLVHSAGSAVLIIEVPPKIWRPKPQNKYIPLDYGDDIHDGHFDFEYKGKAVWRPTTSNGEICIPARDDLIIYDPILHSAELLKGLRINDDVSEAVKLRVKAIVTTYWDCFCEEGARRTILGYEFTIDTGASKPICVKRPNYGPYESAIIMQQILSLEKNNWIEEEFGPWGARIVLAAKPHQEHVLDIKDFIWRMCVSYRQLNSVTRPFEYPIPRCDDAISIMVVGSSCIWIITVDARQGYHQVSVRRCDREKLAFFAPNHKKYTFKVMPFGPTNAPPFYSCMMHQLKDEWEVLFIVRVRSLSSIGGELITIGEDEIITIGGKILYHGSRVIIDDILLWASNLDIILLYFECVCEIFQKYRVSFRLDKCDFLKDRVEYVGHDLTPKGNCPAQSKFDMIRDWTLPTNGRALHSFISLLNFYNHYPPYMEMRLKPLRSLYRQFLRLDIPLMAWSPALIQLFEDTKSMITSSPLLARFDPSKPVFLKTDWSAAGMAWILMQPDDSSESCTAMQLLKETGENTFDFSKNGPRLVPVRFGSRACTDKERWFHSFVGESACGRWGIAQNRKFLWGCHFFWLCDCAAVKEILDYDGPINMIKRWSQELLGYHFTVVHRQEKMMRDVDSLNRFYGNPIETYETIAHIFRDDDKEKRPDAYQKICFHSAKDPTKIGKSSELDAREPRILTDIFIQNYSGIDAAATLSLPAASRMHISTSPVCVVRRCVKSQIESSLDGPVESPMFDAVRHLTAKRLVIDDTTGSSLHWLHTQSKPPISWYVESMFTHEGHCHLVRKLFPQSSITISDLSSIIASTSSTQPNFIDIFFIPYSKAGGNIIQWFQTITDMLTSIWHTLNELLEVNLWIPTSFITPSILITIRSVINQFLPNDWEYGIFDYNAAQFGDKVAANRSHIQMNKVCENGIGRGYALTPLAANETDSGYGQCILEELNDSSRDFAFELPISFTLTPNPDTKEHIWHEPRIVSMVTDSIESVTPCPTSVVLDPTAPCIEPNLQSVRAAFGQRFGIPFQDCLSPRWYSRAVSTMELLRMYSLVEDRISIPDIILDTIPDIDHLLASGMPYNLRIASLNPDCKEGTSIEDSFVDSQDEHVFTVQCYLTSTEPSKTILDWSAAYNNDPSMKLLLSILRKHTPHEIPSDVIKSAPSEYRTLLQRGLLALVSNKIVYFKPILMNERFVTLLLVPESLRRTLFDHYHSGPSGGHMGEYKTLYRMRMRFFWPGLRTDIKSWVKFCAHCVAYNCWRSRASETNFSWPVTVPFWIMHVDLWSPGGVVTDDKGNKGYLLNAMCDITQFAITMPTYQINAATMATLFMENVVLTFGMCAVVVIDDGSPFKGVFKEFCDILGMKYWCLARGNHKGLSVERLHRFLNKVMTIDGNDRGTHAGFIRTAKTAQYAWNSAPIDGTDVVRSVAAVGREFRFPLDVELSPSPTLNNETNSNLFQYLRDTAADSAFALSIVQILIEERRLAHQERHNAGKKQPDFQVDDIVKAHVQVQSILAKGQVQKLSYQARGPFRITQVLGNQSFEVQRYDNPHGATRKYKGADLYLLPPSIFPSEPLDTMDQRYLNYENAPIVSPLRKPLGIELYNELHFHPQPPNTTSPHIDQPSSRIDELAFVPHAPAAPFIPLDTVPVETPIEFLEQPSPVPPHILADQVLASRDQLFFIRYTPADTMRQRWYLVQIDLQATEELNSAWKTNGKYFCVFLARHPDDKNKSDEFARWWPDWYRYSRCKTTQDIIYGDRVLFRPTVTPSSEKYIQWATEVNLSVHSTFLQGPFNFEAINALNRTRNKVERDYWANLRLVCNELAILPPTLGSSHIKAPKIAITAKKRKRKT